jgi:hypothetical protein
MSIPGLRGAVPRPAGQLAWAAIIRPRLADAARPHGTKPPFVALSAPLIVVRAIRDRGRVAGDRTSRSSAARR